MNIKRKTDPFKKYWWVLLLAFGATGGWFCLPFLDLGAGQGAAGGGAHGVSASEQSLDSLGNPQGAPGQALDLSMEGAGAYKKKAQAADSQGSSLYQPPEGAARGAPVSQAAASANLADALKAVSKKSDSSGWGGAAHEKGFNAPRANFGGLSGLGGGGSGSSGASLSFDAFGTAKPQVGMTATRGLGERSQGASQASPGTMGSLKAAQSSGLAASGVHSGDAASALAGKVFDGSGGGTSISSPGPEGGAYANLDAVPINLKPNNPVGNQTYNPVPGAVAPPNTNGELMQMMLMALGSILIGGLIPGIGGQVAMVLMMGMMHSH